MWFGLIGLGSSASASTQRRARLGSEMQWQFCLDQFREARLGCDSVGSLSAVEFRTALN